MKRRRKKRPDSLLQVMGVISTNNFPGSKMYARKMVEIQRNEGNQFCTHRNKKGKEINK